MKYLVPLILVFLLLVSPLPIHAHAVANTVPVSQSQIEPTEGCSSPINYLYTNDDADGTIGGVDELLIEISFDPRDEVRVGFFQTEVGGAGPSWQAATWAAIMLSSTLLGIDPNAYRFVFDVEGYLNGSSIGALTTVGILACILGDAINEDMSFTGSLNPDGTVGPVGGIYYKLQGAADAGLVTVLIPQGQAVEYLEELDQEIDYVAYGQELGIEVIEVIDVVSAYELMTGSTLPLLVGDDVPDLPETAELALEKVYERLEVQYQALAEWQSQELTTMQQRRNHQTLARAEFLADLAGELAGAGQLPAAYDSLAQSVLLLSTLFNQFGAQQSSRSASIAAYGAIVETQTAQITTVQEKLEGASPNSASDAFSLVDAFALLAAGRIPLNHQSAGLQEEFIGESVDHDQYDLLLYDLTRMEMASLTAYDRIEIGYDITGLSRPSLHQLETLYDLLWHATEANLLFVEELEWTEGWLFEDPDYLLARFALTEAESLHGSPEYNDGLARLGYVSAAYLASSALAVLTYSLEPEWDDDTGVLTEIEPVASFEAMLAWARIRGAETLSQAGDYAPVSAILAFQTAEGERSIPDPDIQMRALLHYWRATLQAAQFLSASGLLSEQVANLLDQSGRHSPLWQAGRVRSVTERALDDIRAQTPTVEEAFERPSDLWNLYDRRDQAVKQADGKLIIFHTQDGSVVWASSFELYSNFLVEVDVRFEQYTDLSEAGVIFRVTENPSTEEEDFYFYSIDTEGYYNLWKTTETDWDLLTYGTLTDGDESDMPAQARLGVWAQGDRIALLINGQIVDEVTDSGLNDGYLSPAVYLGEEGKIEVAFDNFRLWTLPTLSSP